MTSIPDRRTRWSALVGGVCVLVLAIVPVRGSHHTWSWPLFVWGMLIGPLWMACAWVLADLLAAAAIRPARIPAEQRETFRHNRWRRWWVGYTSLCLVAIGVGVTSAGLDVAWPDLLLTLAFVVIGLVLPLAAYPAAKRRLANRHDPAGH